MIASNTEGAQRRANISKTRAETMKMRAETRKLMREAYFVPIVAMTGIGCAILAGVTAVCVAALKAAGH